MIEILWTRTTADATDLRGRALDTVRNANDRAIWLFDRYDRPAQNVMLAEWRLMTTCEPR
jgi:hypothetical protein